MKVKEDTATTEFCNQMRMKANVVILTHDMMDKFTGLDSGDSVRMRQHMVKAQTKMRNKKIANVIAVVVT